jgi:hypothetical protein
VRIYVECVATMRQLDTGVAYVEINTLFTPP